MSLSSIEELPAQGAPAEGLSTQESSDESSRQRSHAVLRQSSSVFSAQMLSLGAGVLCTYLLARLGGAEGKGWIYRLQLLAGIGLVLVNAGLGPAAVFLHRREPGEGRTGVNKIDVEETASLLLWPSLLLGSLPLGLLELSRLAPALFHPGSWRAPAELAFAVLPACTLLWNLSYFYLATGRIAAYNRLRASQSCLFALLLVSLCFTHAAGVQRLTLCWMASMTVPALIALMALSRSVGFCRLPAPALLRRALGFAWRSHLGAVAQYLQHRTDVVLILWLLPIRELGVYSLAIGVVELLWYVPQAVSQVLLPHIAGSTEADANRITSTFCRASVAITALLSLTLAALSSWAIPRLLPAFRESVPVIWILLPGTVVASVFKVLASDLNGRGQPLKTVFPATVALLFSAAGCWWVLPRFGLRGAAVVTSLSYFLNAALYIASYARLPEMNLRSLTLLNSSDLAWCFSSLRGTSRGLVAWRRRWES